MTRFIVLTAWALMCITNAVVAQTKNLDAAKNFKRDFKSVIANALSEKSRAEDEFKRQAERRLQQLLSELRGRVVYWVQSANAAKAKETLQGLKEYKNFQASLNRSAQQQPTFESTHTQQFATDLQTLRGKTAEAIRNIEKQYRLETENLKQLALRDLATKKQLAQKTLDQVQLLAIDSEMREIRGLHFSFQADFIHQIAASPNAPLLSWPAFAIAPFDAKRAKTHQEAWAKHLSVPVELKSENGILFRLIPPGIFIMGSNSFPNNPLKTATIDRPFYLASTEMDQATYQSIAKNNPSLHKDPRAPVENILKPEIDSFIDAANKQLKTNPSGLLSGYYLPSEQEWEYACRAGSEFKYFWGQTPNVIGEYAWYADNSGDRIINGKQLYYEKKHDDYYRYITSLGARPQPVKMKRPNPWGLYDMIGNVWEVTGTRSPFSKVERYIHRGGSFGEGSTRECLNSRFRGGWGLSNRSVHVGFRLAAALNLEPATLQKIKASLSNLETTYQLPIEPGQQMAQNSWKSFKRFLHPTLPNHSFEQLDATTWRETFIRNGNPIQANLQLVRRTPSFIELEDTSRSMTYRITADGYAWQRKGEEGNGWLAISEGEFTP